jgi:hypothetical protein
MIYAVVGAVVLSFLDWYRSPEPSIPGIDETDTAKVATVALPVGPIA